jgi:hypothetical protein
MPTIATPKNTTTPTDDREAKRRAIAEARASIVEDGTISHETMGEWLGSWGTPNELLPPKPCK